MAKENGISFSFDRRINLANMTAFITIIVAAIAGYFRMEGQIVQNSMAIVYNTERIERGDEEHEKDRSEILAILNAINDNLKGKADKPAH